MGKLDKTGKLILFGSIGLLIAGFIFQSKMTPSRREADANATQPPPKMGGGNQSHLNPSPTNAVIVPPTPGTNIPPVIQPVPVVAEKTVVLANAFVEYTFTSRGGGISNVKLIEKDGEKKNRLKYPKEIEDQRKGPLEMKLDRGRLPLLSFEPYSGEMVHTPNANRPYKAQTTYSSIIKAGNTVTVKGTHGSWTVEKVFTLGNAYLLDVEVRVSNASAATSNEQVFYLVAGTANEPLSSSRMMGLGFGTMWYDGEEEKSVGSGWFGNYRMGCACFGSLGERNNYRAGQGNVRWVGGFSRFFIQSVIPAEPGASVNINQFTLDALSEAEAKELDVKVTNNQKAYETSLLVKVPLLPASGTHTFQYKLYTGPREYDRLRKIGVQQGGNQFHRIMDFGGWFGWLAEGLLRVMKWFHAKGLSYALAIIAITFIIKLVFWPITARSTRAMKKMAAVNAKMMPEITKIREKYKDDYQKMNLKMMEIYKKYGVNPLSQMGGCLPMLIQIPVFFGFFTMLRSAVELRGAEFLWVADLSSPDTVMEIYGFPINILPLLMTGTMFLQMRLQPPSPTMDPSQQAIMKYMPLMFVFILYSASAGLCLYWTVQNVLSIVQTKMTKIDPEEENPVEVIPPKKQKKRKK
jgi:YidC/Oxa1 family membrane protein insertase